MTFASPITKAGQPKQPPHLEGRKFDLEAILPRDLIRQHCKIDDVIRVPNALLDVYRNAAFEAAENYTGLLFREIRVIQQSAANARDLTAGHKWKDSFKLRLDYPTADGLLYLYGGKHTLEVITIRVTPGDTEVRIPINHYALDMTPCCGDPCGKQPANFDRMVMYKAGYSCEQDVPACIVMGVLKYIAFVVENPGGDSLTNPNMSSVNPQTSRNNAAWMSGAIEEWRVCMKDAI